VRHLRLLDATKHNGAVIEIGVAFVGKRPPDSFLKDPSTRYDIANLKSGMWALQEGSAELLSEADPSDKRNETRHTIPMEITLEVFGGEREAPQIENTVTENISQRGAAVFTALNLERGRFVKLRTRDGIEVLAVVRNRIVGADGIARLHLQFVGREWQF
ncbi:MAG TPA: PilZ domain-containing protein, partial [Pyrinomonadaceae bacterium]|nr:PilZ domain-containing protein [Pyrinomonadaceae bacterium]